MQAIGLLSLLVELRVRTMTAPKRDFPTTAPASSQLHIVNEVVALANSVSKTAEAVLNLQLAVDPTTVRTPAPIHHHLSDNFTRWQLHFNSSD
jgi:hypothetical protein